MVIYVQRWLVPTTTTDQCGHIPVHVLEHLLHSTPHTHPSPSPSTHTHTHRFIVPAMSRVSFLNRTLTHNQKMSRISEYYKFMMIRDPLERLVSAYRDKMAAPLMAGYEKLFPDKVKVAILERYGLTNILCACDTCTV